MKRQQAVFSIQTSQRGRTVRSSTNHLGGVETASYTYNLLSWPARRDSVATA